MVMALTRSSQWTDLYYKIVGHYFWNPAEIGRVSDKSKPSHHWRHWESKLRKQEAPLNHILDFLFYLAPQDLLDDVISKMLGRRVTNLELVVADREVLSGNLVQPDIIVTNGSDLIFVEMKVESQSSIDQFVKYAIAAHCLTKSERSLKSASLVLLAKHTNFQSLWKNAKKLDITDAKSLRSVAIRGLDGDSSVWSQKSVQRYLSTTPDARSSVRRHVKDLELSIANYGDLTSVLEAHPTNESIVSRIIEGVLSEIKQRL